ncbi:MAG: hypothetical protein AAF721_23215 [Myxococcota bacterium]
MAVTGGCAGDDGASDGGGSSGTGGTTGAGPGGSSGTSAATTAGSSDGGSGPGADSSTGADATGTASTTTGATSTGGESSGETGTTAGGDTGTDDTSTGGGTEGTSTGVAMPDGCFDPLIFPFDGPLCGPAANPCAVLAAETIEPTVIARNGTPSIAFDNECQPAVLHAQSVGGALGFFARRQGDDDWDVAGTPFPMSQGGLDFDPQSETFVAMAYEGGFNMSARTYDGNWDAGDPLMGSFSLSTKAFALSGDASLHGVLRESGVAFADATWDAAWSTAATSSGATDVNAALAVAPGGGHHYTYWHYADDGPVLRWETSDGDLEEVIAYGDDIVSSALVQEIALVDGGDPQPYVLVATETAPDDRVEIFVVRRDAANTWTAFVVASEDPTAETNCNAAPFMPGQSCTLDRTTYRPLAIAASLGGDVRWLYSETHQLIDYESECAANCIWVPVADASTYGTWLGWLEGGAAAATELLPDVRITRANAEIDGEGTMHVVAYADVIPDTISNGTTVEYFRIGSP